MSVNKAIIMGRLGKDPEIRAVGNADVANLSVATSERWKSKQTGEWEEKTEWHRVNVWGEKGKGTLKFIEDNLRKGDQVYLEGSIETRKWKDQQDVEKFSTEIKVGAFNGTVQKIWEKNDNERSGNGRDDRGGRDDRDDRGSRSSSRDRDDRGGRDDRDDRGGNSRGSSSRNDRDDRGSSRNDDRGGSNNRGGGGRNDMDDDIPF
jgi:single-strand DNA-binding protein